MKKFITALITAILISYTISATAKETKITLQSTQPEAQITDFIDKYNKCTNEHNIDCLKSLYAQNFISGDGISFDDYFKMIQETWSDYPEIKYSSAVKNVRVNNNFASIESFDESNGETGEKSNVTGDIGTLNSISHMLTYLQRYGRDWKIISDKILYEKTSIKYGKAKTANIDFIAPEQTYAGEDYTASLYVEVPDNIVAIGSIAHEPIVYPQPKPEEVFRQIPSETGVLERVMKANNTNNNELTSASIGFTEMTEDLNQNSYVKLSGLALLLTRVNIIPKSTYILPKDTPKTYSDDSDENSTPEQSPKG